MPWRSGLAVASTPEACPVLGALGYPVLGTPWVSSVEAKHDGVVT